MSGFHWGGALIIKGIPNMVTNRIHKEDVRSWRKKVGKPKSPIFKIFYDQLNKM